LNIKDVVSNNEQLKHWVVGCTLYMGCYGMINPLHCIKYSTPIYYLTQHYK